MIQIKQSLPTRISADFDGTPDDAKTVLLGQDLDRTVVASLPTFQQDGISNRYVGNLICDELGKHTLYVYNGADTLLKEFEFECVQATDREIVLGVQNYNIGTYKPDLTSAVLGGTTSETSMSTTDTVVFSDGRYNLQQAGDIGIVEIQTKSTGAGDGWLDAKIDSFRVFTGYWVNEGAGTYKVRSISEDIKTYSPYVGTMPTVRDFVQFKLERILRAEPGDFLGVWVTLNSVSLGDHIYRRGLTSPFNTNNIFYKQNTALSINGTNTTAQWSTITDVLGIRARFPRPSIALGGHSFWAGTGNMFSDNGTPDAYDVLEDPAPILNKMLDVPVMNAAVGGSSILGWTSGTGYLLGHIDNMRPAVLLYDSLYNEPGRTSASWLTELDKLLSALEQRGIKLIMLESPSSDVNYTTSLADDIRRLNSVTRRWCDLTSTPFISLYWRIGKNGGSEASWARDQTKTDPGNSLYEDYGHTDNVHLSTEGKLAAMRQIATMFQSGLPLNTQISTPVSTESSIVPTASAIASVADITSSNSGGAASQTR